MRMNNGKFYLLRHNYYYGNNNQHEAIKELGIYTTKKQAKEAINRYKILPGFNNFTLDCFEIIEFDIDVFEIK